jgi:hypothetical protein
VASLFSKFLSSDIFALLDGPGTSVSVVLTRGVDKFFKRQQFGIDSIMFGGGTQYPFVDTPSQARLRDDLGDVINHG